MDAIADSSPIRLDSDGTARVGETRVRLASVLHLHQQGVAPEEIAERFPSLLLGDIYGAIAYYLHHRQEVDTHLAEQKTKAEHIRQEVEARSETEELRATLFHRKTWHR